MSTTVDSAVIAAGDPAEGSQTSRFFVSALRKALRRNKVAQVAVLILFVVILVGIFGPLIAPHDPAAQQLTERLRPPVWLQRPFPRSSAGH